MRAATSAPSFFSRSARSTPPSASDFTSTTSYPAIAVDAVVHLAEPRVMPDDVELGDLGEFRGGRAAILRRDQLVGAARRHVGLGQRVRDAPLRGQLEDELVVGARHHATALPSASANRSISSRVLFSVTATRRQSPSFRSNVLSGTPASHPCFTSRVATRSGGFGSRSVNSLKKGAAKRSETPGIAVSRSAA